MKNLYLGDSQCRMKNLPHSSLSIITKPQFCQSPLLSFLSKLRFRRSQSSSLPSFLSKLWFCQSHPSSLHRFSVSFGFAEAIPIPHSSFFSISISSFMPAEAPLAITWIFRSIGTLIGFGSIKYILQFRLA